MHLMELVRRRQQSVDRGVAAEFDYLDTKVNIIRGVIHMYEKYCDQKWTLLQKESALSLQEVLDGVISNRTASLTPPLTPQQSPQAHSSPISNDAEYLDNEFHIHTIPTLLTPIRDINDPMFTPPSSPRSQDNFYYSHNLMNSSLTDLFTRDF